MFEVKKRAMGIRFLLALGMLSMMVTASAETPATVRAHGGDASLVHLCVNDTDAQVRLVHPLPVGDANIDCVNPPWPLGTGWSPVDLGTISGVTAGTGLTGGGSIGPVTLDADTAFLQQRVSGIYAPGSTIRVINQDGTVSCETDSDTTFDGTDFALSNPECSVGQLVNGVDIKGNVTCEPGPVGVGAVLVTDEVRITPLVPVLFSIGPGVFEPSGEGHAQMAVPRDGVLVNLFVVPGQAPAAGSIMNVSVRVNRSDTALSVTHTDRDGRNARGNTLDSISVSQGDLISVKFSKMAGIDSEGSYRVTFLLDL